MSQVIKKGSGKAHEVCRNTPLQEFAHEVKQKLGLFVDAPRVLEVNKTKDARGS